MKEVEVLYRDDFKAYYVIIKGPVAKDEIKAVSFSEINDLFVWLKEYFTNPNWNSRILSAANSDR